MKNTKAPLVALALFICGLLPLAAAAQNDSTKNQSAQSDTTKKTHKKHKWLLGLEVNTLGNSPLPFNDPYDLYYYGYDAFNNNSSVTSKSFSFGIRGNYYLKNDLSLKLRTGLEKYSASLLESDTDIVVPLEKATKTENAFYLTLGVQQDFQINKITNFHAGIDFTFTYYGMFNEIVNVTVKDSTALNTATTTYVVPEGVTFGIGPAIGLTFKLCKHMGLGAEITDALVYQFLGGKETYTETSTNATLYSSNGEYVYKSWGFTNSGVTVSIFLSYLF
jgi:hypothetical protein